MSDLLECLQEYDVSVETGFLPSKPLLKRLPETYNPWEDVTNNIPTLVVERRLEDAVLSLPTLSTHSLKKEDEWRRAYVILGFISNAYLWSGQGSRRKLPASVAVPFMSVSDHLSLPAVPTYCAQNLWNFQYKDLSCPRDDPDNIEMMATFTGLETESWFYALPTVIEARSGPIIQSALKGVQAVRENDLQSLMHYLNEVKSGINSLTSLLPRMYEKCDPSEFYNLVRPFLAGTKSSESPNGILYETNDGAAVLQNFAGPTAAQSSIFPFLDIILGIRHDDLEAPQRLEVNHRAKFLEEMRAHMPKGHRQFLDRVAQSANISQAVRCHEEDPMLFEAHSACIQALASYRQKHLQVVTRYIVIPARTSRQSEQREPEPGSAGRMAASDLETKVLGTGGSAPITFLKEMSLDTKRAISKV